MKFSVNWLREFVELPASVDELAELLTMAGVEIEAIEKRGADFDKVVVAQIRESKQHPNADRLSVCVVDDGSGTARQIVCGAKNYKPGDKVPLALPGANLPGDLKIRESKLRGVESQGMLCSAIELGLGADSSGLLILSADAPIGAPIGTLFPADTIFDVEITPNRPDLLSHFGLAREIAALTGKTSTLPPIGELAPAAAGVHITARRECPFYSARRIENVTIGASPEWLRAKIESVGVRSINNIVDITNFVMLELGQPLHAFDADKLSGGIDVRLANEGENFLALDGRTYALGQANLVIADQQRAVAIAGVMGGEETGVTATTRNVLLESAYFLPTSVRRTARTLNLPSDSSYRFERGVDPGMVMRASERATDLIRELAHGEAQSNVAMAGELPADPPNLSLRYAHANRAIGIRIEHKRMDEILRHFGLTEAGHSADAESWWRIPSHRRDLRREEDLIEEIVRAVGVNAVPGANRSRFTATSDADRAFDFQMRMRECLAACGFFEAKTSALVPRGTPGALELRNPLSEDHVALRPSLLPGLLNVLERNLRAGAASVRLFEIGRVFGTTDTAEHRVVALVLNGVANSNPHWRAPSTRRLDMFDAKGAIEALGANCVFRRAERAGFALAADIVIGETAIGVVGQLGAMETGRIGASAPIIFSEMQLEPLLELHQRAARYSELERFPAVSRDIAMIVPEQVQHDEIERVIRSANEPLLAGAELFDLFSGKGAESLGAGKKSMAYTLTYRDKNRTLTNDEVTVVHTRIRERLRRELGAELRE
jgi:phenylalanyl-tRNA synthetase beta chain